MLNRLGFFLHRENFYDPIMLNRPNAKFFSPTKINFFFQLKIKKGSTPMERPLNIKQIIYFVIE